MAQQLEVKVNGLAKITQLADKYPAIARKHIDIAIRDSLVEIDRQVIPLTPVKSNRLKSSLKPIFRPFEGVYGTNVPYAADVHNMYEAGTPYKRPSLNKNAVAGFMVVGAKNAQRDMDKIFKDALTDITKDLAKK